jgi:hypothetical protein
MIATLLAVLAQIQTELREKTPEVRILLRVKGSDPDPVVSVRRRVATARDGAMGESWADSAGLLAEAQRGELRAELTLPHAGTYRVEFGRDSVQVRVSRTELRAWKEDVDQLRAIIRRLEEVAEAIDQAGATPPRSLVSLLRRRLAGERDKMRRLGPDFYATPRVLEEMIDALYTYRSFVALPARPSEEAKKGYDGRPVEHKDDAAACSMVKPLREILSHEGALLLLEELDLLLPLSRPDPAEVRIVRWRDRARAIEELRKCCQALETLPGIDALLQDALGGAEPDALRPRLEKEREALLKF